MSTQSRRRSRSTEDDALDDEFSFVTDDDIAAFMAAQEVEEEQAEAKNDGFWNLQTASGMGLIGLGGLYAMQLAGLLSLPTAALGALVQVLPVFAAILIMLTGFGVLSWSPAARRQRKARRRAAKRRARQRKTMGRQQNRRRTADAAGRRASEAFSQAERAVRAAGRAASSEARKAASKSRTRRTRAERAGRRLTRDRSNRKISGVAAGIADYFGLDPTIVRIAFVIGTMMTQGAALLLYIILSIALPTNDPSLDDDDPVIQVFDD